MKRWVVAVAVIAFSMGCDWDQAALLNGVSVQHEVSESRLVKVYLALDGVSHPAMVEAQQRGAFSDFDLAKSIPMFPATSDASWSRILRTEPFGGYEYTYYDPNADKVSNDGFGGLVSHAAPHPHGSEDFPYYDAFDVHGAGYLDSVEKYAAPELIYREALDQLFILLAGRMATQTTFTGYLLELDIVGHYGQQDAMVDMLVELSQRIDKFKADHPEVTFQFTLFSDHGVDNVRKPPENFVTQADILRSVGVEPAKNFRDAAKRGLSLWAVAPEHTRVTYGTLNTPPELVPEIARRISTSDAVDLVIAQVQAPEGAPAASDWVSLFLSGQEVLRFGFDAQTDTYWLPASGAYAQLDVDPPFTTGAAWEGFSDETLFAATAHRRYPDLFYRARTSLLPIGVRNSAPVLFSLREEYALKGLSMPFAEEAGAGGSHGAMGGIGSQAMLASEERDLPGVIRSESILDMFPSMRAHLEARGVTLVPGEANAALEEAALRAIH
ncbi:MAG: hypothetical protein WBV82_20175 [Myxococcaceae bacterium]